MEKHELSKIDFEIIEDAFKSLLQSQPDPVAVDKIVDLRAAAHAGDREGARPRSIKHPQLQPGDIRRNPPRHGPRPMSSAIAVQ
jgi:hypothetical protein